MKLVVRLSSRLVASGLGLHVKYGLPIARSLIWSITSGAGHLVSCGVMELWSDVERVFVVVDHDDCELV